MHLNAKLGWLALSAAVAFPGLAFAEQGQGITAFQLTNGLEVVVIEDHRAPAVVQMLWYKVGSADEPRGHSGIAHFLEHLMFKGTEGNPNADFSGQVENLGGDDNAFTSNDYTAYFQRVAADHLEMIMRMESDRMRNLRLTEDDVSTERDVILEERAQTTESDPGRLLQEQVDAALYLNHPYGTPVIGWRHEMAQLSWQDAFDFYRANYAPNNAILIIAGDVTPERVRSLAETYYQPIEMSDNVTRSERAQEPVHLVERRLTLADERVAEASLQRHYLAVERNTGDQKTAAALTILAEILGGDGTTSFLGQRLQFGENPVAVWSGAGYGGVSVDQTSFVLYLQPAPGVSLEQAETAMDKALADFMETGVDPDHLARIKTQARASEIYAMDDAMQRARSYGAALSTGLTLQDIDAWPDLLAAVTAEDVMAAARAVLVRDSAVTAFLTPKNGADQ